jgi:hypothetical protein
MKNKRALTFFLVVLLTLITVTVVYAGTTSTNGGVGDARCTASKTINQFSSSWDAYVKSQCDLGIGIIGRMWWTVRQYCYISGTYPVNKQYGGEVYQNTNYYQKVTNSIYVGCPNGETKQFDNLGRHDFRTVLNTWQPTVNRTEYR